MHYRQPRAVENPPGLVPEGVLQYRMVVNGAQVPHTAPDGNAPVFVRRPFHCIEHIRRRLRYQCRHTLHGRQFIVAHVLGGTVAVVQTASIEPPTCFASFMLSMLEFGPTFVAHYLPLSA